MYNFTRVAIVLKLFSVLWLFRWFWSILLLLLSFLVVLFQCLWLCKPTRNVKVIQ